LYGLPRAATVAVTDVVISEVDTGVGDAYEATAHAVWQAIRVKHPVPYVGFSDPRMVTSWLKNMVGRRLDAVTEARHWYEGRRAPDAESLLHAWLFFEYAVPVSLHGRGDQLLLAKQNPYTSYDMDKSGQTRVGPARHPDVLAEFIGARLTDGAVIVADAVCGGLVLCFENRDLVIGTLADEWVLAIAEVPAAAARYWAVQPFVYGGTRWPLPFILAPQACMPVWLVSPRAPDPYRPDRAGPPAAATASMPTSATRL
jgi:hypothetical protein